MFYLRKEYREMAIINIAAVLESPVSQVVQG